MNVRADQILHALARQYADKDYGSGTSYGFWTQVKTGATTAHDGNAALGVLDALAIAKSWAHPDLVGFEVKISRADFLRDQKWPFYLDFCHRLYFVCPSGVIQPAEVDERVGLMWYAPDTKGLVTRKKARYRDIPLPTTLLYYVVMSKLERDRHPFFSNTREFLEAWLEDRTTRTALASHVSNRMTKLIAEANELAEDARSRAFSAEADAGRWLKVKRILDEFGLKDAGYDYRPWQAELRAALSARIPRALTEVVARLQRDTEQIAALLRQGDSEQAPTPSEVSV